ncbi:MAG: S8 family peptidase [Elusimicrobiaceae bacterium]|nr:S8 family peptidase [Elusimicrobiaceae bacterium]
MQIRIFCGRFKIWNLINWFLVNFCFERLAKTILITITMKKVSKKIVSVLLVFSFILVAFNSINLSSAQSANKAVRKIIVFNDNFSDKEAKKGLLKKFGAEDLGDLNLINGRVVLLPEKAVASLKKLSDVKRVEDDVMFYALGKPSSPPGKDKDKEPQPAQEASWGHERIGASEANITNKGAGIRVGIIDSGISLKHPDLNVVGGINTINTRKSYDDDLGHGSHVAGTVAALDNEIGVIGVAPEAELYAIKVLNRRGVGYLSDIIEGLQWSIDNNMQVVNMSLGRLTPSVSYEEAINKVYNAGITIVAAAGNDGDLRDSNHEIYYPARYANTIAVSATDIEDNLAWFSSWGTGIDLTAPGQDINSTYKGDGYHIGNGTSMATPHVVGVVALILNTQVGIYDLDGDEEWDPVEVKNKLQAGAENLGLTTEKQGAGLVSALSGV